MADEDLMNISDLFIEKICETAAAAPEGRTLTETRRCLLDFAGAACGGRSLLREKTDRLLELEPPCDGVTVINSGAKASLQTAALLNGMAAHVFDIDDGNRLTSIHLGAPIISALLSVGEWNDLSLEDIFRGIAAGYEAANRMGKCIQPHHRKRGYHASGTCGTIGAALGVGAALRFSEEEMKAALCAACTAASGILEMQENASTLKPYNIGRAAHDGVTSALMAKAGFRGPDDPLTGKFGFIKAVADDWNTDMLVCSLPENLTVLGSYHKIHASCRHTHGAVDAARAILEKHPGTVPASIERITVRMYEQGVKGHDHTEVNSPVAGKMSIPFATALAIVKGSVGFSDFTDGNISDEEVQRLCAATEVIADERLTAQAPAIREAVVEIDLKDGTVFRESVKYPKGEPEYPLTEGDIRAKFADLAACGKLDAEKAGRTADLILAGPPETKVRELMHLISGNS